MTSGCFSRMNNSNSSSPRLLVTVLAYLFWDQQSIKERLPLLKKAIFETWRHCGELKTVIVANRESQSAAESFASEHGSVIDVQIEPLLQSGSVFSMSVDCNSRLHKRFDTEAVLVMQDDGYPLQSGLEKFVGKWDFIGAPIIRNKWHVQAVARLLNCRVMNGGFSLRSKRCCEMASFYWNRKYQTAQDTKSVSEDIFYTQTLPLRERAYRRTMRFPSFDEALSFSYDDIVKHDIRKLPFGFHRNSTLESLRGIPK